ncbi:hypothetical protein ZIOFF_016169 [Zingiber officinale]|uniref:Amine oxidase domain-containing protein n=1 Tax=Zingiber officinale TaxID=94328 RepID=A0A8J5I2C9_ZINOF|nr:hypothetical protein ZIOFF_016169 [Zingiber officinale]
MKSTNTSFYQKTEARQSRSLSAIVIGGGFAGIAAAHALKNAAFQCVKWLGKFVSHGSLFFIPQVVLLESRDRIGGRVHTNYSFGFPVDMGAAYYALFDGDGHQVPQDLVEKVGKVEFEGLGELRSKDEEDEGLGELRSKDEEDEGI